MIPWSALRARKVGLVTSLARPDRVLRFLAQRGVSPVELASRADHDSARSVRQGRVDVWLASPKCAVALTGVAVMDYRYVLAPGLKKVVSAW
jgi:tetraacyldisaccharide-1-P 4'-kinase